MTYLKSIWIFTVTWVPSLALLSSFPTPISRSNVGLLAHSETGCDSKFFFDRRAFTIASSGVMVCAPGLANAIVPKDRYLLVGEGFDLLAEDKIREKDVLYPISMVGSWICDRVVTDVSGDEFQASEAWRCLGGPNKLKANMAESFRTRYIRSPLIEAEGVVNDRGFELSSRANIDASWAVDNPNFLNYDKVKLAVKSRSIELPSEKGFGFDELIRIDDGPYIIRAVQIKRRYRRAFDESGNRLVEGLEIMKTFRVLDGVAGTELPTSVVKSQIRLRRS